MHCSRCGQPIPNPGGPCPHCGFAADPALCEELAHVSWLLEEMRSWAALDAKARRRLEERYEARRRQLEVDLDLRPPPLSEEAARRAWLAVLRLQALLQWIGEWQAAGLVHATVAEVVADDFRRQAQRLLARLEGQGRPPDLNLQTEAGTLALIDLTLRAVDRLSRAQAFVTAEAERKVRAGLEAQKAELEVRLGLRAAPPAGDEEPPEPVEMEVALPAAAPAPQPAAAPAPPPLPWRERLWRTLLSERTLQAMLFVGIFLLFAAAISFVIWGWRDFTPALRVLIPALFTATFFALGWGVRHKTRLYRSGIALTAIAALLIPVDSYSLYANLRIPPAYGPLFWLLTSLVCLAAYSATMLLTQSAVFGYLVGSAAGSAALALVALAHQELGLSPGWWSAALSALAAGLVPLAAALDRSPGAPRWRLAVEPFRHLALLAAGALMLLSLGERYTGPAGYGPLHYAMAADWWLGGLILAWGSIHYRSRGLGIVAALSLPVATCMAQAALLDRAGANLAWHALGLALLVPLYFAAGHALLERREDPVLRAHGRMATGWGIALLVGAGLWSLTDLTSSAAGASSHAVLAVALVLAALLWRRPAVLYAASWFSLTSLTFTLGELNLSLAQLAVGWASLAIAHVIAAVAVGDRLGAAEAGRTDGAAPSAAEAWAVPPVVAGLVVGALSLLPPLGEHDWRLLSYLLANWLGLALWGARLAHERRPGFGTLDARCRSLFHWLAAPALPAWVWLQFHNRGPLNASLPLALAALAWAMVALGHLLSRSSAAYRRPWRVAGLLVSVASAATAFAVAGQGFAPAQCLLAAGLLYVADAVAGRQALELAPGGLVTAWGYGLLLDRLGVPFDPLTFALAALAAAYVAAGLMVERRRSPAWTHRLLQPWYVTAHLVAVVVLCRIYTRPWGHLLWGGPWTDGMRLWGAGGQLLLGAAYSLYAWATYREHWAYAGAWLMAGGAGFVAVVFSRGRGSLAAKVALGAAAFVLAERWLHRMRCRRARGRVQATFRLAWRLYRRPLLVTGWLASAAAIGLALVRNLILLGGGRTQQIWAAVGLLLVSGLYALSARLFRRARFAWLATLLLLAPWTILTNLGWLMGPRPATPAFAVSWMALAWLLYLGGLIVAGRAPRAYALPLKWAAHVLIPFALLWGVADVDTGRITFGLAATLYGLGTVLDHRRVRGRGAVRLWGGCARYLYPALGLVPVWSIYLLAWLAPDARHEHYGLMLVAFGVLGLLAGRALRRLAPRAGDADAYALPAYLTGYVSALVGTLLVAHDQPLLAAVLAYDALLMVASAWLFRHPLWAYPAAALLPLSLILALDHWGVPGDRQGWWLIGLAAVYLAAAWALRRRRLAAYGTAPLMVGLALVALGLPPSSQDRSGALWGYSGAALLYAAVAFWLRQPLLLSPACALAVVPYGVGLLELGLRPEHHGLALLPGSLVALGCAWWLDRSRGRWRDFPWGRPAGWLPALARRLFGWWALPLYLLGFGLAGASPFFTAGEAGLAALNWALLLPLLGWALYRFRLRGWLLVAGLAGHLAVGLYLQELGWWRYRAYGWLRLLPLVLVTVALAMAVERRRSEGSPLQLRRCLAGWSRPLYALALADFLIGQTAALGKTDAGAAVTLVHALVVGVLASYWASRRLPYAAMVLGTLALGQWLASLGWESLAWPVPLARLALAYGLAGYALASVWERRLARPPAWLDVWERPLQRFGSWLSLGVLALTAWLGPDLARWTARALLGFPFRRMAELDTVRMVVGVLALLGLLYVAAAFVGRRLRLGYLATGMLLAAWMLHAFYVQQWEGTAQVQWYALPAGLYLLGVAGLEWQRGNKTLARWLDYMGVLLMMGSLFWQTVLFGWRYALLLGGEGFAAMWWGSARRLRRFLYAGMMGVILATAAQLINSLRSINQWVVFGVIGLLVVAAAIAVERRLEDIKAWRQVLESWE